MAKLLLVDDSEEIVEIVVNALEPLGMSVDTADSVKTALEKIASERYDLLIIDIGLPDGDGFGLFLEVKNLPNYALVSAIFLTSKEDISSKVTAFSLGADDYIVKPFDVRELRARIENQFRKQLVRSTTSDQVLAGPFILEVSSQRLKVRGQTGYISLTPKEFKIMHLLAKNSDRIFSREHILDKILGSNIHVTDRTVDAHICYLRKKLGDLATYIESVPGEGYRFNPAQTPKARATK